FCRLFSFFTAPSTTVIYTLSLHDALPIFAFSSSVSLNIYLFCAGFSFGFLPLLFCFLFLFSIIKSILIFFNHSTSEKWFSSLRKDRKSTRLNSSHVKISYAVFCLKKKTKR